METRSSQSKSSTWTTWSSGSSSDQELWPGTSKTKSRPLSLFKSQDSSSSSDEGDCIETRCYSSQLTKSPTSPKTSKQLEAVPPQSMGLLGRYSNVVIGIAIFDVVLSLVALICWGIAVLLMVMIVLQKRPDKAPGDTTSTSDANARSFGAARIFLYSFHPMFYLLSLLAAILMAARIEKMTELRDLQPQLVKRACVWWILASFWHGLEMEFVIFTLAKQPASMILPITYLIVHLAFKVLATTLVGLLLDTDSISDCKKLVFETFYIS